jgi:hypothetical protein
VSRLDRQVRRPIPVLTLCRGNLRRSDEQAKGGTGSRRPGAGHARDMLAAWFVAAELKRRRWRSPKRLPGASLSPVAYMR